MHKLVPAILLSYMCFVAFILVQSGEANDKHVRNRRHLVYTNGSRFFLKLNFKANIVPWNQLFAQAIGFRMNWDEPPMTFHPFRRLYRRSVYDYAETLLDKNGLNGYHCVRRAICEAHMILETSNVYHKLMKIVFRKQSTATERWHNSTEENCMESISFCPFSLLEVSPYTDLG